MTTPERRACGGKRRSEGRRAAADRRRPAAPPLPGRLAALPGAWRRLTAIECARLGERIAAYAQAARAVAVLPGPFEVQDAWFMPLEFYPGYLHVAARLAIGAHESWLDALVGPAFFCCLDGTSDLIHALDAGTLPRGAPDGPCFPAALRPLAPSAAASAYVRFFVHAVRSHDVTFRLIESVDALRGQGVDGAEGYSRHLTPLRLSWETREHERMRGAAALLYRGALYRCLLSVAPDGGVQMVSDEEISVGPLVPPEATDGWLRDIRPRPLAARRGPYEESNR